MTSATPTCRACGSTQLTLRGKKLGEFIREEFAFHTCRDCELLFVEPFSGFEIYNDAYYRGQGPDPFVDYATEYRDYRCTDRALEFADLARLAESHLAVSPSPPLPLSPSFPPPPPSPHLPPPPPPLPCTGSTSVAAPAASSNFSASAPRSPAARSRSPATTSVPTPPSSNPPTVSASSTSTKSPASRPRPTM